MTLGGTESFGGTLVMSFQVGIGLCGTLFPLANYGQGVVESKPGHTESSLSPILCIICVTAAGFIKLTWDGIHYV